MRHLHGPGAASAAAILVLLFAGCHTPKPDSTAGATPPTLSGTPYTVQPGDTVHSIARKFNIDWRDLLDANRTLDPRNMPLGSVIMIPGSATAIEPTAPEQPPQAPDVPISPPRAEPGPIAAESKFIWPVRGRVVTRFRQAVAANHNEPSYGIEIRTEPGAPVAAAKSGQVSTFTHVGGFGKVVTLQHQDGTLSFYGRLDTITAQHGTWVRQGTQIGTVGPSGRTGAAELHFRVYRGDQLADPLPLLR